MHPSWRNFLTVFVSLAVGSVGMSQTGDKEPSSSKPSKLVLPLQGLFAGPEGKFSGDPDSARLITTDITHFWRAYDKANPKNLAEVLERDYFKQASPGLQDFIRLRISNAETLARTIQACPKYYAAARESTLRIPAMEKRIRATFYALKHLYPDAVFPDVYFVIGRMSSGGTTSPRGLLIGTEMYARTPQTSEKELSDWHKQVLLSVDKVPLIVAHELIHFQQKHPSAQKSSLLAQSIIEGAADLVGELIAGEHINQHLHTYGNAREKQLWEEFRREMDGNKATAWLYNGTNSKDRPADLGYYMGYKIVESYYGRAKEKKQAIKEILTIQDFAKFLKASGYEEKIRKLPQQK